MERSTPDAEGFEKVREVSSGTRTGAEDDRRRRLDYRLPFHRSGFRFLPVHFYPGLFRLPGRRLWGSSSKTKGRLWRVGEEIKKVRLSYVRWCENVVLLQG